MSWAVNSRRMVVLNRASSSEGKSCLRKHKTRLTLRVRIRFCDDRNNIAAVVNMFQDFDVQWFQAVTSGCDEVQYSMNTCVGNVLATVDTRFLLKVRGKFIIEALHNWLPAEKALVFSITAHQKRKLRARKKRKESLDQTEVLYQRCKFQPFRVIQRVTKSGRVDKC